MRKLLAMALIGLMLFVMALPAVSSPIDHVTKTEIIKKPELVFINDAVFVSVDEVQTEVLKIFVKNELVLGVKTKVPTNNNSPPTIRILRC